MCRELRADTSDGTSTVHVEIDITNLKTKYVTADNLGVYPRNDFKIAGKMAKAFGLNPKTVVKVTTSDESKHPLNTQPVATVQDLMLYYLDITAIARAKLAETLSMYAADPKEKQSMLNAAKDSKQWQKEMLSVYELFEKWTSLQVPFEVFLELCPKLQPRFYTISSSSKKQPNTIAATVILDTTEKEGGRVHKGVCSTFLKNLQASKSEVCAFVRDSSFRLPKDSSAPIICVGPGTGIAPFRAFLQEAMLEHEQGKDTRHMTLFFGCRYAKRDYIYEEELKAAHESGVLDKLHVAFSRDQEKKVYVQDLLAKEGSAVWDALKNGGASFYVCGGTAMGRSVRQALQKIAQENGNLSPDRAQSFVEKLERDNRYVAELWSR